MIAADRTGPPVLGEDKPAFAEDGPPVLVEDKPAFVEDKPPALAEGPAIASAMARRVIGTTGMNAFATSIALPAGLISTVITIQYLSPSQFGQLGLLMVLASFLTVLYNLGLLHGTFLWVYGMSGDGADADVEIEGKGRASVAEQRIGMGTGLILTVIAVVSGTAVCLMLAKPLAALLLGSAGHANLIGLAAVSGGSGSIYRLTSNVFRFERRFRAFVLATIARPVGVLVGSTGLVMAGYGVWGAVLGTVVPTLACAVACVVATRRSYVPRLSLDGIRQIAIRGGAVVIPVVGLWVAHSGDLYLLSYWVHGSELGVYRLASRLGSPPSYLATAVMVSWGPLERSALFAAAYHRHGRPQVRSVMCTYYVLAGLTIVVLFVAFSRLLSLIAPRSYADAAKVVPLIALAFVVYGAYIVLLRTTRPERMLLWYGVTAALSAACFVGSSFLLIPSLGIYGAPAALTLGMGVGCAIVIWRNARNMERMPIEYRRMLAGILVAGAASAVVFAGAGAGRTIAVLSTALALIAYLPGLIVTGALPSSHMPFFKSMLSWRRAMPLSPGALAPAEEHALTRLRAGTLRESAEPVHYARLTRALRKLGRIGAPSPADARIGRYLASEEPEAVRDFELHELIGNGIDAFELHHLDLLAKAARKSRFAARLERASRAGDGVRSRAG